MRGKRALAGLVLLSALGLLFCGCAGKVEETAAPDSSGTSPPPGEYTPFPGSDENGVALTACFRGQDGAPLAGTALLSAGGVSQGYPLDGEGQVRVSGLPRQGVLDVRLLDSGQKELGAAAVYFTLGEVIDASADQDGTGYVTLREDTPALSLVFAADGQGRLWCALLLEP